MYIVDKKAFVEWYFSESDDFIFYNKKLKDDLIEKDKFILTTQDLLTATAFVPGHLLIPEQDDEVTPDQCIFDKVWEG